MLQEQETAAAKYTAGGKRKFKAKLLSMQDRSLSVFGRSASTSQAIPETSALDKLKFRMTKNDFRQNATPTPFQAPEPSPDQPQEKERRLPEETFNPTSEDFRQKSE